MAPIRDRERRSALGRRSGKLVAVALARLGQPNNNNNNYNESRRTNRAVVGLSLGSLITPQRADCGLTFGFSLASRWLLVGSSILSHRLGWTRTSSMQISEPLAVGRPPVAGRSAANRVANWMLPIHLIIVPILVQWRPLSREQSRPSDLDEMAGWLAGCVAAPRCA